MFCPNCGKEISDSSKFCLYCGHKFEQDENEDIYSHSYYKESYVRTHKSPNKKRDFSFLDSFIKGVSAMLLLLILVVALMMGKNYFSGDILNLDKMKYQQYVENPSLIPELTQPETLNGFINNLKDVQNFLELYLKVSDDSMEDKLETFDKYRKELLKFETLDNTSLLDANVKYQIPRTEKEFKVVQKQYNKILSKVGLTIQADESYSKYYLAEDARYTCKKFGKYMPSDIQQYLKLRAKHYKQSMYKDEICVSPWELAQRIGDYENFMNSNKEFRYIDEVKDLLFKYTFLYSFTSDRTNMIYINKKTFKKSDAKFLKTYTLTQLKDLFTHLMNSANGISETQFDEMYPYEYQKGLDAITPEKAELSDVFTIVRKNIIKLRSDDNFEYMYISSDSTWAKYNPEKSLKKGDVILAHTEDGYEVYDYKYKKTNQTIQLEENATFFIKEDQLYAYSPNHLQIKSLDCMYGTFSFRVLSVRAIKKIFPEVLIINIDTFGESSVQIDKPSGAKTYMLISTAGGDYRDYHLSGNMSLGELSNIFTVSEDRAQVDFSSPDSAENYHIYFINQQAGQVEHTETSDTVN